MSKPVDKTLYKNYLQKAEEMLEVAEYAHARSKNNAAVAASVHCAISALDALSVFYLGKRRSGVHDAALGEVRAVLTQTEFRDLSKQLSGLLALKNEAEYQPDLMKAGQARDAVTRAERIMARVRQKLP